MRLLCHNVQSVKSVKQHETAKVQLTLISHNACSDKSREHLCKKKDSSGTFYIV